MKIICTICARAWMLCLFDTQSCQLIRLPQQGAGSQQRRGSKGRRCVGVDGELGQKNSFIRSPSCSTPASSHFQMTHLVRATTLLPFAISMLLATAALDAKPRGIFVRLKALGQVGLLDATADLLEILKVLL